MLLFAVSAITAKGQVNAIGTPTGDSNNVKSSTKPNDTLARFKEHILQGVTVTTQHERNAGRIMKKVEKNMDKNYGHPAFDQTFTIDELVSNFDTTQSKITYSLSQHLDEDQVSALIQRLTLHSDTANYNAPFFNFIGAPDLDLWYVVNSFDFLRKGIVTGKKSGHQFEYKLLGEYTDENYGLVYRISFKPRDAEHGSFYGTNQSDIRPGWWGRFSGEMLVNKSDYAIVNIKYAQYVEVARKKQGIESLYHSHDWPADKVTRIIPYAETLTDEYIYTKNAATGKYFVNAAKFNCYENGYQVANNQRVQLYFRVNVSSIAIENVRLAAK